MPPSLQILTGSPAFSRAHLARKLRQMQAREPQVRGLFAEFIHLLFMEGELDERERAMVDALLRYGPRRESAQADRRPVLRHRPPARHRLALVQQSHGHLPPLRVARRGPGGARPALAF